MATTISGGDGDFIGKCYDCGKTLKTVDEYIDCYLCNEITCKGCDCGCLFDGVEEDER